MRASLLILPIACLSSYGAVAARAEEGEPSVPASARIHVEPDHEHWILGENVIVRYVVENAGDEAFPVAWGGDSRSIRPIRTIVEVRDEEGRLLEDPWPDPPCLGGIGGTRTVTTTEPFVLEVPVPRYRVLDRPGTFRVRVFHDLGWGPKGIEHGESAVPSDDPRWAETTIVLREPAAEGIGHALDVMHALPDAGNRTLLQKNRPWSDFRTLRHPAYLDALVERARARSHESNWLDGIRSIATREATAALVALLLESPSVARADAVVERVPPPEHVPGLIDLVAMVGPDLLARRRLADTWSDEHAEAVRAWARENMGGRHPDWARQAAYLIASLGTADDLPAVTRAIDDALQYDAASAAIRADPDHRGLLGQLYGAATLLLRRGAAPPETWETRGELAVLLLLLRDGGEGARERYAQVPEDALRHEDPAIRDLAVRCLATRPVPDALRPLLVQALDTDDAELRISVLQALARLGDERDRGAVEEQLRLADEDRWLHAADLAAAAVGIATSSRLRIHAEGLTDEEGFRSRMGLLISWLETQGWGSSGVPDAPERSRLRDAWLAFLGAHAEEIDEGRRFPVTDPEVRPLIASTDDVRPPR